MFLLDIPLLPCAYKQLFGISCPMCGFQRSVLLSAQGRVGDSIMMFPPMVALVVASVYYAFLLLRGKSLKGHRWIWIFVFTMFAFNLVYQNIVQPSF